MECAACHTAIHIRPWDAHGVWRTRARSALKKKMLACQALPAREGARDRARPRRAQFPRLLPALRRIAGRRPGPRRRVRPGRRRGCVGFSLPGGPAARQPVVEAFPDVWKMYDAALKGMEARLISRDARAASGSTSCGGEDMEAFLLLYLKISCFPWMILADIA